MAHLFLVRHAQASFFGADYDSLSALGCEQAAALGRHWAEHRLELGAVYVGPRRRHRQTCDIVAAAYRAAGLAFAEPIELAELDEHHGATVMAHQLGRPAALGPQNLAVLRHMALNLVRKQSSKGSLRKKLRRASWSDAFLASVLAQL